MIEFYNKPRVLAHFKDLFTDEIIHQEIGFITYPFDSQKDANEYTLEQVLRWAEDNAQTKYETSVELSYWEAM
jgi:hypothetical protein